ncbi:X2-like carbohydrate binding domain-containing protein [Paludicola sp. MB14-C6]|uniref:X2-like carbohydrate binding domain-containing protein n=1 Tax=Paludihabitans sp. MB14-C6 TaxID=3070656 RepID=UPI0027DBFE1B|nr:X2-like carbohydrate binding domain-containing protein [Paludicola sp. MB14-C6]WMJ22997.1 X2-like carbohydrate binding domain-containing protein [Paludicola sp. MB14-C6]
MKKRIISMILAVSMVFTVFSGLAFTESVGISLATTNLNMYHLSYFEGKTGANSATCYYVAPTVSGTDNSPTISFPQKDGTHPGNTVCSGGAVTSKYSMDFTRSFAIEGSAGFASRDGISFALHNNPNKKAFAPNYSTCMLEQSYQDLSYNTTNFTLNNGSNDIEKGLLWEFMQITNDVTNSRAYKGAYSYKINSLNNMSAFPDDNQSGHGGYGIKNYGVSNQDGPFTLKWECTDASTATGKLTMLMGSSTFTYSNLCAKDVFGSLDNAKMVYFTMSSWAPAYITGLNLDDQTKTSSFTIDKAYYTDSASVNGSTLDISSKYFVDADNNGSYETQITGDETINPNQNVLVRNIISNKNKNTKEPVTTTLLIPNISVTDGTTDTKISSPLDTKFYWKEHNGTETLRNDMCHSVGNGPFNTTNIYDDYARITLPAGGDGTNIYEDAYAVYEYTINPNSNSEKIKETIQIGVSPFTPTINNSEISFVKTTKPSVNLNTPVFINDKSGYCFKSATINNFTLVTGITFSASKSTTVQYVPKFLTPSSKLESINGETRTFTYVFDKGITVSQAEEFIRGIIFNYVAGSEISVTIDNNVNKLPDGAKITKFAHPDGTNHYYMYVPSDFISWSTAYNESKSYTYMGQKGYLATVTSQEEDSVLTNISTTSAWSAGTRYLNMDRSTFADPTSVSALIEKANYYYWACGPEAGTIYYNSISPTPTPGSGNTGYNGAYNNWGANPAQPDAYNDIEACMQVNWPFDNGANEKMRWNDLPNEGLPNLDLVKGYFVEFSNYAGGVDSNYSSDKTAITSYDLMTDGGVEEVTTVTLNEPVYGSTSKSVFSFDNAEITNISTVYSLTVKLDNYTNVLAKPTAPVPSNELSNIAGATNMITYQFQNGISQAEAQSFLRGLKFRYGGLKNSSKTNVSVTVDGNKTNLPKEANITEYNGHYYMYVDEPLSWTDAYNKAKTYSYMGNIGYLATITSAEEDKLLDNISLNGAWSAGTRYTGTYDTSTAPNGALDQYFKWSCGPEAGTNYYYFNSTADKYPVDSAYNGFVDLGEPNGWYNPEDGKTECCMQVHYKGAFNNSNNAWNDLRDVIYDGSNGLKVGYFVEFSDYSGGRVDGFIQSANGKSTVPITVEKGDVFNSVKEGGTYYVDTILTAFDHNINQISVNGASVLSGYTLPGNKNTAFSILATDLEGNTATTNITMKTIASISEPIKSLTVNNVQTSNIPSILAVKSTLKSIDQTTASDVQKAEITNAIQNCNTLYWSLFHAIATAPNGTNGWYKSGIDAISLTAPSGFEISTSATGSWTNSLTVNKADGQNKTASYYLKDTSTGEISDEKTFSYKIDTVAPAGKIAIKANHFTSFLNTITFGIFMKNTVDVTISATDALSTPVTVSYQKVTPSNSYNENGTWINGSSFSVKANEKFSVYAKITDNAGNTSIINTQGVVVYTDSTENTTDISFTRTSTTDITAKVNLNGNTIQEISNGGKVIASSNYSVATDGTITFHASYLNTLAAGTYTLIVNYSPMGESYTSGTSIGDAPATTTLTLAVNGKDLSDDNDNPKADITITPYSHTYNGKVFHPTVTVKDGTNLLTVDTDYTISWDSDMTNAGEKTLMVTFKGIYSGTAVRKATIANAEITDTTNKAQSATYSGSAKSISAPTATSINAQPLTVKYSTDGTTYTLSSPPKFTDAGNYTVYYQFSAPNHNSITEKIRFTINAATDNKISGLSLESWKVDNKANEPKATATYGTPVFTYSDSENGVYTSIVPIKAGSYFVKASVAATDNYNACESKINFTIFNKDNFFTKPNNHNPQTGDTSILIWLALLLIISGILTFLCFTKKPKKNSAE